MIAVTLLIAPDCVQLTVEGIPMTVVGGDCVQWPKVGPRISW
jgi:hypothetical protein